ncbi:MAG: EVE domain-containing protein [Rhodospirillales bacterium]|nr:EVE domain-containing protein [Rhodospirillales bacterium]
MKRNWIAVAAANHVCRGRASGFMQVCHGKAAPLRRVRPGDRAAYYSPTSAFRGKDKLQAFTAIGVVQAGEPYRVDTGDGFCTFRRDVAWIDACAAPIRPLLDTLEFAAGAGNWGRQLRFGLFAISDHDMRLVATAMAVRLPD